jgi:hypothetical protein
MGNGLPDIAPEERTPLVVTLLEIIAQLREEIQQLRDEIAILKGQKPRPKIRPSQLEQPTPPSQSTETTDPKTKKRPGSDKRSKNAQLTIHNEVIVPVADAPAGSVAVGYEDFIIQDIVLEARNIRYRRQQVRTPDGRMVLAPLPEGVSTPAFPHFGPTLVGYILQQHYDNHVTQPQLLEALLELGIDISAGQINNILTEKKDDFHAEKDEVLQAGLQASTYVGVDDTGARHQGKNGYCTHIGNELFAYFESTDCKSRLNFLQILRRPHTDYVINEVAVAYWERQGLTARLMKQLQRGVQEFADEPAWRARLAELGISGERHVRIATEGALLGCLIAHGVSPQLVVLSDGAAQFDVLVHAACWVHAERPLVRMIPYSEPHRAAIEKLRDQIWSLYKDLKAYRQNPDAAQKPILEARFDELVEQRTDFPNINGVLKEMREHKADLLCVLEHPEVPLHNNISETHVRDYVKKRKISGGTRSDAGRRCRDTFASLKKTCRCLGIAFWQFLKDRLLGLGKIARLGSIIRERAAENPSPIVPTVAVPA